MSDTTARDRLARIIWDCEYLSRAVLADCEDIADEIVSRGWRPPAHTVTTVEELDALPDGTIIRDALGDTWTLYEGLDDGIDPDDPTNYRWAIGLNGNYPTYVTALPATVLYEPEEGE